MTWLTFSSIRYRLLMLVLLAALPGFGLIPVMAIQQRQLANDRARMIVQQVAQAINGQQLLLLQSSQMRLQTLAMATEVASAVTATRSQTQPCEAFLADQLNRSRDQYANFGVVTAQGEVLCSAVPFVGEINVGDRLWFQNALQNRNLSLGEYHVSRIIRRPTVVLAYPLLNPEGSVDRVVFASLELAWLNPLLANENLPNGATANVIDRQGIIVASYPEPQRWVGQSINHTPLFQDLVTASDEAIAILEAPDLEQNLRLFAFAELFSQNSASLYVTVGFPQSYIAAEVNHSLWRNLLLMGSVTALALLLAGLASHIWITQPVNHLVQVTQQLAGGDLEVRVMSSYQPGELGLLGQMFNRMAAALAQQQQLQHTTMQRERELTDLKARFVAMVSHELRSPLAVMRMAVELLGHTDASMSGDRQQLYLQRLRSSIRTMTQLMEEVLIVGQLEEHQFELELTRLNLPEFCLALLSEIQDSMETQTQINWTWQGTDVWVELDGRLLRSILTNLLTNAVKYSPPDSVIEFQATRHDEIVTLQVQDQGIGIPPEDLRRLFEAFHRGRNVGRIQGTGLGLTIVKHSVELHRGQITVESQVGVGTQITVLLPAHPASPAATT